MPVLEALHPAPFPRGPHCSDAGAFVDNVPLLRWTGVGGARIWAPRTPAALGLDLGAGYALSVDARRLSGDLGAVAGALNEGRLAAARSALAALQLPAFPHRTDGRLDPASHRGVVKALRKISLLRDAETSKAGYNPDEPRDDRGRWTREGAGVAEDVGLIRFRQLSVTDFQRFERGRQVFCAERERLIGAQ